MAASGVSSGAGHLRPVCGLVCACTRAKVCQGCSSGAALWCAAGAPAGRSLCGRDGRQEWPRGDGHLSRWRRGGPRGQPSGCPGLTRTSRIGRCRGLQCWQRRRSARQPHLCAPPPARKAHGVGATWHWYECRGPRSASGCRADGRKQYKPSPRLVTAQLAQALSQSAVAPQDHCTKATASVPTVSPQRPQPQRANRCVALPAIRAAAVSAFTAAITAAAGPPHCMPPQRLTNVVAHQPRCRLQSGTSMRWQATHSCNSVGTGRTCTHAAASETHLCWRHVHGHVPGPTAELVARNRARHYGRICGAWAMAGRRIGGLLPLQLAPAPHAAAAPRQQHCRVACSVDGEQAGMSRSTAHASS